MFERTYRLICPIYKQIEQTLQDAGGAPYRTRQPEIHAAQDGEGEITIMQKIQIKKRNVDTYTSRVSGIGEGEEKNP